jgi:hypothetical protein
MEAAMYRYTTSAVVLLVALPGTASAQVNLQWKFKEGDTFYLEEKWHSKGTVGNGPEKQKRDSNAVRLWHFVVKTPTPTATVLEGRIELWKIPDKDDPEKNHIWYEEQAARECAFTLHLAPSGAVTKIEGVGSFVARWEKIVRKGGNSGKVVLTDEQFLDALPLAFDVLPETAVKVGDTWKKSGRINLGTAGILKIDALFSYLDSSKGAALCSLRAAMSFDPFTAYCSDTYKFQPKVKEAQGDVVFDVAKGRLILLKLMVPLVGTISCERDGAEQGQWQVDVVDTWTLRFHDKKPAG